MGATAARAARAAWLARVARVARVATLAMALAAGATAWVMWAAVIKPAVKARVAYGAPALGASPAVSRVEIRVVLRKVVSDILQQLAPEKAANGNQREKRVSMRIPRFLEEAVIS